MFLKKSYIIIFILITNLSFCQLRGIVIDSTTMKPIENVNIRFENDSTGTTTNREGIFELNKYNNVKWLKFSSIGYEDKKIMIDSLKSIITLKQKIYILDGILIESKKIIKIGNLKKSKIKDYFTSASGNLKIGRYFPFFEKYKNKKYINKIKIVTKSEIDNVTFKVSLYESDSTGKPNKLIYNENIFGVAKKGKSYSEIDLSYLNIQIPKNGIFISLEWVYNDGNKYEIKMNGVNYSVQLLEPKFGIMYGNSKSNSWIYSKGDWEKVREVTRSKNKKILKYVPMEIILTE